MEERQDGLLWRFMPTSRRLRPLASQGANLSLGAWKSKQAERALLNETSSTNLGGSEQSHVALPGIVLRCIKLYRAARTPS